MCVPAQLPLLFMSHDKFPTISHCFLQSSAVLGPSTETVKRIRIQIQILQFISTSEIQIITWFTPGYLARLSRTSEDRVFSCSFIFSSIFSNQPQTSASHSWTHLLYKWVISTLEPISCPDASSRAIFKFFVRALTTNTSNWTSWSWFINWAKQSLKGTSQDWLIHNGKICGGKKQREDKFTVSQNIEHFRSEQQEKWHWQLVSE